MKPKIIIKKEIWPVYQYAGYFFVKNICDFIDIKIV